MHVMPDGRNFLGESAPNTFGVFTRVIVRIFGIIITLNDQPDLIISRVYTLVFVKARDEGVSQPRSIAAD